MTDDERNAFLLGRRLATLAIERSDKAPVVAPIWYRYTPGGPFEMCMGATSLKARCLRNAGRAALSVQDDGHPYRYVTAEGPVTLRLLGDGTRAAILAMATRYLGAAGGTLYTDRFMTRLEADDLHEGHGTEEIMVHLDPVRWRTKVFG